VKPRRPRFDALGVSVELWHCRLVIGRKWQSWFVTAVCLAGASLATVRGRAQPERDAATASEDAAAKRLYADAFTVWIYKAARRSLTPIGYLRGGQSVALRNVKPWFGNDCAGGWYAVEPAGFVCKGLGVSLDATRYSQAMQTLSARPGAYPFDYGVSLGAPAYRRLPFANEALLPDVFGAPDEPVWSEPRLLSSAPVVAAPLPWFLIGGGSVTRARETRLTRREVPPKTLLSVVSRFEDAGRSYYQAADGTIVPADRLKLFRRTTFAGVWLQGSQQLPLSWPRAITPTQRLTDRCRLKLTPDMPVTIPGTLSEPIRVLRDCFEPAPERLPARTAVALSGRRALVEGRLLVETRDGLWAFESSLYVALAERPSHGLSHAREKWIHFSIQHGTLVAYEGATAVFATLASPGSGELNAKGKRRLTPTGTFRINFKHIADDMSSEDGEHRAEWKADVPYAMYFKQPYGIHVSYWHEDFGDPKSGGCINVSPEDGARLFDWTDPQLPEGWFGVGSSKEFGLGTVVHITK
jgi:hypothetical protein